jgi:hypothetical protein
MSIKKLEGTLVYVQVQKPVDCYVKEKGQELKASIVVDEETADAWNEMYPKQPAKVVKTAEFEAMFKVPAPLPSEKKQYVITLRKNTKLSNGEPVPDKYIPKLFQRNAEGLLEDITQTVLPANGSKGALAVEHYDGKLGAVARLKNVLVTELIEYQARDEGGDTGFDEAPVAAPKAEAVRTAPKPAAKSAATKQAPIPAFAEDEDQNPF